MPCYDCLIVVHTVPSIDAQLIFNLMHTRSSDHSLYMSDEVHASPDDVNDDSAQDE